MTLSSEICFKKLGKETLPQATFVSEREKLLKDFEKQRKEMIEKCDKNIREIVNNYERRIKYLKKLIEEYEINSTELKSSLNFRIRENLTLRNQISDLQKLAIQSNIKKSWSNNDANEELPIKHFEVKYDGGIEEPNSIGIEKSFSANNKAILTVKGVLDTDLHENCRKEFFKLSTELRRQKKKFDMQILNEREFMQSMLEDEKMQFEKVAFKQLNNKIEKELKRTEMLCTEKNHLQNTISEIMKSALICFENCKESTCGCNVNNCSETFDSKKNPENFCIKPEFGVSSCKLICKLLKRHKDLLTQTYQVKINHKKNKFKIQLQTLNKELQILRHENDYLKKCFYKEYLEEFADLYSEVREKLIVVKDYLKEDCFIENNDSLL